MTAPGRDAKPWAKTKPKVALFPMDQESMNSLSESFTQFGIDVSRASDGRIFHAEKLEGCAVSLASDNAEAILAEARGSAWQKRMVVYGVGTSSQLRGVTQYGINVLLQPPVARAAAIKAVHSTRLLLLNELRRYVRLPLAAPVTIESQSRKWIATAMEISIGGMSLTTDDHVPQPETVVSACFVVPGSEQLSISSTVCWCNEVDRQFGLRFERSAPDRELVNAWIESYLGLE